MTYEEALKLSEELKGHMYNGVLSSYIEQLHTLYKAVFGREIKECNCKSRYTDALAEVYNYLKQNKHMKESCKARLLAGVILHFIDSNEVYSNANLTDDVAREYLKMYPQKAGLFSALPDMEEKKLNENLVKEVAEKLNAGVLKKDLKAEYIGSVYEEENITQRRFGEYLKRAEQYMSENTGEPEEEQTATEEE